MRKKALAITAIAVVAVGGVGAGAYAAFGGDDEVTERGACAGTSYELSVEDDDGGLELGYELQSSRPGEVWQVLVEQGDQQVLQGERTTDDDGEIDLDAPVDEDGASEFTVTATPAQGEPCVATVTR